MINLESKVGPYVGVSKGQTVEFPSGKKYLIIVYGAYNAYGLIGPESNGIAVLDEVERAVVLDQHCQENSGYFGPSKKQLVEWQRLIQLNEHELTQFIGHHPRARDEYRIWQPANVIWN